MFACLGIVISVNLLHVGEFSFQTFFFFFHVYKKTFVSSFHIIFDASVLKSFESAPIVFSTQICLYKMLHWFLTPAKLWHVYNAILLIKNKHKTTKQSPFEPMNKRSDLSNTLQKVAEIIHKCLQYVIVFCLFL